MSEAAFRAGRRYRPAFLDTYRGQPGGSLRLRHRVRVAFHVPGEGWSRFRYRDGPRRFFFLGAPAFHLLVKVHDPVTLPPERRGGW